MKTIMNVDKLNTIDQLTDFLDGTQPIAFCLASNKAERYQWVQQNIAKFHYRDLNKKAVKEETRGNCQEGR